MAYRSEMNANRARRLDLERELAEVEARARDFAYLEVRVQELRQAIAALDDGHTAFARNRLPMLSDAKIASPCRSNWEDMEGDAHVRFCKVCEKNVYDLSSLTAPETEALLREKNGDLCARLYIRADDTILTQDCPVGVRRKWLLRSGGAALVSAGVTTMILAAFHYAEPPPDLATCEVTGVEGAPIPADKPAESGVLNAQKMPDVPHPFATSAPPVIRDLPPGRHVMGGIRALPRRER